ncbi:alkaline phosphatase [Nitrospira sp. KM1]|uniref:alkaline phosphatase D family protein n=1 Tax=Nitrospira sp. KM1 TaxID=1936990 RepID=UPI001E29089E|nr:alkaline phosphatase D family protein [Nitrospira sp. KM1]
MRTRPNTLILAIVSSVFFLSFGCTSPSREGLPPGSPFGDEAVAGEVLFPYGVAVGDVSSRSAVLWLRTDWPKAVQVEWAPADIWDKAASVASVQAPVSRSKVSVTGRATDFTLSVPLQGLQPDTRYRYHITVKDPNPSKKDGLGIVAARGEFTTWPDSVQSASLTFAWSGDLGGQGRCRQGEAGYPIFDVIRSARPEFFLFLGDTIYADNLCPSPPNDPGADFIATTLEQYRVRHRYQRGALALRRLLETVPVYVMWDDHEVRNNFSGASEPLMPAGRQAFREYWPMATVPEDANRFYRSIRYGKVLEVFLLDVRQYRSLNSEPDGPAKTMLGFRQLTWLLEGLKASDATWKVIVSGVPLSVPKGGGTAIPGYDGWAGGPDGTGFERERQVIVGTILDDHMKNVVFLTGDVHWVQANEYDPDEDGVSDFYEFVAGPLSANPGRLTAPGPALHPKNLINESGYDNFGLARVTPDVFEVRMLDAQGRERFAHTVKAR